MPEPEPRSIGINVGDHARVGKIDIAGHVAGGNIVIGGTDVAEVQDRQQLLSMLQTLQAEVAALKDAPPGLKDDVADELRKAHDAGQQNDSKRLTRSSTPPAPI